MEITQLSPNIGANIDGIDLGKPLSPEIIQNIKEAWDEHLVIRFRNQSINDDDLLRFSKYFGELDPPGPNPYGITFLPEYPEINVISNVKAADGTPMGNLGDGEAVWHADMTYIEKPPEAGILHALEIPVGQGHTYFANMIKAYDALPNELKEAIEGKILIHDAAHNSAGMLRKGYSEVTDPRDTPGARHPLVWTNQNGRKALFLGRRPHAYILGLPLSESELLLDKLWSHATNSAWTWFNEWQVGDVLMWQNLLVLHRRDAFDGSIRRVMHRTQLKSLAA